MKTAREYAVYMITGKEYWEILLVTKAGAKRVSGGDFQTFLIRLNTKQ
jgi:hypothetical protein